MNEVTVEALPFARLQEVVSPERAERLPEAARRAREVLEGRTVWNVNATATGGGVAEMLEPLLAYAQGCGIDARWLVLDGPAEFFTLTKRIHNLIHGSAGDGGTLGAEERALFDEVTEQNLAEMSGVVRPGDLVVLHDPQTAGLVEGVRELGARVVWRSHVGLDVTNEQTDLVWGFLRSYVEDADALVFTREAYAPGWAATDRVHLIPPSIDPFSPKNRHLEEQEVRDTLRTAGLVDGDGDGAGAEFLRGDGSSAPVRAHSGLIEGDLLVPADSRVVLQVSRWDRLKDMAGVLTAFADRIDDLPADVHLMLVGPDVTGVSDDPEGQEVLEECLAVWREQPESTRARVHLVNLPMDDGDENAHLVNALQQHATVVVQKSRVEGFGLTVTEPMWKARPVVATRVGGIQDQISHGESGLLLDDPEDLDGFADLLQSLLSDEPAARRIGEAARERVREQYLGDRHLLQYLELFSTLLGADG